MSQFLDGKVRQMEDKAKLSDEEIKKLQRDLRDCRNELCLRCGNYENAHKGACDGCRWENV